MRLLLWILIPLHLLGCSEGIFSDDDAKPTVAESTEEYRVPTITIKRLESEKIEERPAVRGEKITWRLHADPAPVKDVVVHVSIPTSNNQSVDIGVLIPKFRPSSEKFTDTIYGGAIEVVALPMLSIVGEGLVVNVEKVRDGLPSNTYGGHRIPMDFDFPLYNVGNPSQILCDDCSAPASLAQPTLPTTPPPPVREEPPPPVQEDVGPPPATNVHVFPVPGTTITSDPQFVLTFNQGVIAATVNGFSATGFGLNWSVSPVLAGESVSLDVRWANQDGSTGSKAVGPYTVRDPDRTPPRIVNGTVVNGDLKVSPRPINAAGFRFDFNEPVTGSIKLLDASGVNLNWIANVDARIATLTPFAGKKLLPESAYSIEINVQDAAGNPNQIHIVFVTDIAKK